MLSYGICPSLYDLIHLAWETLVASMQLWMALFHLTISILTDFIQIIYTEKNPNYITNQYNNFPKASHLTQSKSWSTYKWPVRHNMIKHTVSFKTIPYCYHLTHPIPPTLVSDLFLKMMASLDLRACAHSWSLYMQRTIVFPELKFSIKRHCL